MNCFLKIIKSKSLWLTDASSMNDTMECQWHLRHVDKYLGEYMQQGGDEKIGDSLRDIIRQNTTSRFLACFSENGDLLSQWRGYADDGRGIAIGFDIDKIDITNEFPTMSVVAAHQLGLCQIEYDESIQYVLIEHLLDDFLKDDKKNYYNLIRCSILSSMFKNSAFKEEQEWRIVYVPIITTNEDFTSAKIMGDGLPHDFRDTKYGISPYFIWYFSKCKENPIVDIVIGPQNRTKHEDICLLLTDNKYDNFKMRYSTASYRN